LQKISSTDYLSRPSQPLNVILVAHAACVKLNFLRRLGVGIQEILSILAALDTPRIAKGVLGKNLSSKDLLEELGCPFQILKDAGNGANATLRALLMLAERNRETVASQTEARWDTLTLLRGIGTAPIPDIGLRK
jgi:hypothetical protein